MSTLVLAGGTDVAAMPFFSCDTLPPKADNSSPVPLDAGAAA